MVITEKLNELIEIRPGRKVFTRHWILNDDNGSGRTDDINLVCVHGTAASQEQYLLLWKAIANNLSSSSVRIHCWAYDAIGCGRSPKIEKQPEAYTDAEQVQDLKELVENHVQSSKYETYFVGHSYGPTWICKYLKLSTGTSSSKIQKVAGVIFLSSGLECKELVVGGPSIFKVLPLWTLNCIQPLLTLSFLKIGFSPYTHKHKKELIQQAKQSNNQNDMQTVVYYYQAHEWLSQLDDDSILPPALVMHGMDDEVIPLHCGQHLANQLDTTLVVLPNTSHMILVEAPDPVADDILKFITSTQQSE